MSLRHIDDAQSVNTEIRRSRTRRVWQVRRDDLQAAKVFRPLSTNYNMFSSSSVRSAAAAVAAAAAVTAAEQGVTASRTSHYIGNIISALG